MTALIHFIIFCAIVAILAYAYYRKNNPLPPHKVIYQLKKEGAVLVYNGELEADYFVSIDHRIRAIPDFIYQMPDGSCAIVEFKSRKSGIKDSDLVQIVATAIAVKESSQFDIKYGYVVNGSGDYKALNFDLPIDVLANDIKVPLNKARKIKEGLFVDPETTRAKCNTCGYNNSCSYSKAGSGGFSQQNKFSIQNIFDRLN